VCTGTDNLGGILNFRVPQNHLTSFEVLVHHDFANLNPRDRGRTGGSTDYRHQFKYQYSIIMTLNGPMTLTLTHLS
jgi:hypothetical protein